MQTSIGIDLGTTYCCVVHYGSDGNSTVVSNAAGEELTPSVVHISDGGEVLVGEDAKQLLADEPENVIIGIKRHMGKEYPLEYAGQTLTPESISALILSKLATDSAEELGVSLDQLHAVVTVPAYFGVAEREATAAAIRISGLYCPELLPEPVAAAYAYGLANEPHKTSLVYDLGGGTFDLAVVGMDQGRYRVWAVDGESQLGGLDWDRRIEELLWAAFDEIEGAEDLRYEEEVIAAVQSTSERVKRRLTGASEVTERLRLGGHTLQLSLTQQQFDDATADLMQRTFDAVDRVIAGARLAGASTVDQVLLVGGSTRMPMVREQLETRLGLPVLLADPDRAVAKGAAILSEQILAANENRTIKLNGVTTMAAQTARIAAVTPRSIGVLTYTSHDPYREDPYVSHFVPANTPLPVHRHAHVVATMVRNQTSARIELFEQAGTVASELIEDNRRLIEAEVLGIPPGPAGMRIALVISVTVDGRVALEATAGEHGVPVIVEAFMHGVLDEAEVAEQRQATSGLRMVR